MRAPRRRSSSRPAFDGRSGASATPGYGSRTRPCLGPRPRGCFRLFTCQRTTREHSRVSRETLASALAGAVREVDAPAVVGRVPSGCGSRRWGVANNIATAGRVNGCWEDSFSDLPDPLIPPKLGGALLSAEETGDLQQIAVPPLRAVGQSLTLKREPQFIAEVASGSMVPQFKSPQRMKSPDMTDLQTSPRNIRRCGALVQGGNGIFCLLSFFLRGGASAPLSRERR